MDWEGGKLASSMTFSNKKNESNPAGLLGLDNLIPRVYGFWHLSDLKNIKFDISCYTACFMKQHIRLNHILRVLFKKGLYIYLKIQIASLDQTKGPPSLAVLATAASQYLPNSQAENPGINLSPPFIPSIWNLEKSIGIKI